MKQSVSPLVAVVVIVVIVAVVGFFYWRSSSVAGTREGDKSFAMPQEASQSLSEVLGNRQGQTAPTGGSTHPGGPRPLPGASGGIPTGPMTGPGSR